MRTFLEIDLILRSANKSGSSEARAAAGQAASEALRQTEIAHPAEPKTRATANPNGASSGHQITSNVTVSGGATPASGA